MATPVAPSPLDKSIFGGPGCLPTTAKLTAHRRPLNGQCVLVAAKGFFEYVSSNTSTPDGSSVLAPDDATPGNWIYTAMTPAYFSVGTGPFATSGDLRGPALFTANAYSSIGNVLVFSVDGNRNITFGGGFGASIQFGLATVRWPETVTTPTLKQAARTTDAAPQAFTLEPQAPYASATGTNRDPAHQIIALAAPAGASTAEGRLQVNRGGSHYVSVGKYPGGGYGAFWAGPITPNTNNFVFLGDGSVNSYLNVPTGGSIRLSFNGVAGTGFDMTETLGTFVVPIEFSGQTSCATNGLAFTGTPTWNWNLSNHVIMGTMTASITSITAQNPRDGATYTVQVTQDGTGGRTITWPAAFKFGLLSAVPGAAAGEVTVWEFRYEVGTSSYRCLSRNVYAS